MKRLLAAALGLAWLAVGTGTVFAQAPGYRPNSYAPFNNGPGLSPYLNLARPGSPAINYFTGTVPEQDRRANQRSVQSTLQNLENRLDNQAEADDLVSQLGGAGHPTGFGNFGSYFGQGPALESDLLADPRRHAPAKEIMPGNEHSVRLVATSGSLVARSF